MATFLSKPVIDLFKTGRYPIKTPEGTSPLITTILYLDGDVINFSNLEELEKRGELYEEHLGKTGHVIDSVRESLKRIEKTSVISVLLLSLLTSFHKDIDFWMTLCSSSILGILLLRFKNIVLRIFIKVFYRKLLT